MPTFTTFSQAEGQFPQQDGLCYLNHAAVSPWACCTEKAVSAFAKENVISGAQHYPQWLKVEQSLRERLAQLIGIDSTKEIALAKNTSEALSIIAYGLEWQEGDEVIISNQEFPSNRIVWESLSQFGVSVKTANIDEQDPIEAISALVNTKTRLVSISSIQYASGIVTDLEALGKLCKANKCLLCVDAIQSLGALPFNQKSIDADFIVADGHKWMMASEGLALLYVKEAHIPTLKLYQYGWHMIEQRGNYDSLEWNAATDAKRFECGSPNMLGIHALNASLELLLDIGINNIHAALCERIDYLEKQLSTIEGLEFVSRKASSSALQSGIICFKIKDIDSAKLYQTLMSKGVICANRGGGVRFSPHFYTTQGVIDEAVAILKSVMSEIS
jgi:selenocysteine lyase/cysteine desulfurase